VAGLCGFSSVKNGKCHATKVCAPTGKYIYIKSNKQLTIRAFPPVFVENPMHLSTTCEKPCAKSLDSGRFHGMII
jgi:hypothetical protein